MQVDVLVPAAGARHSAFGFGKSRRVENNDIPGPAAAGCHRFGGISFGCRFSPCLGLRRRTGCPLGALFQPFHLVAQEGKRIVHYKFHPVRKPVQFHVGFGALNGVCRNVETGDFLRPVFAGMQREAPGMREAFEHRRAVPIRESNRLAAFIHRKSLQRAVLCFHFLKGNAASSAPALD
ncbi:hypothetical protein D3C71_1629740 [compost metagenome]